MAMELMPYREADASQSAQETSESSVARPSAGDGDWEAMLCNRCRQLDLKYLFGNDRGRDQYQRRTTQPMRPDLNNNSPGFSEHCHLCPVFQGAFQDYCPDNARLWWDTSRVIDVSLYFGRVTGLTHWQMVCDWRKSFLGWPMVLRFLSGRQIDPELVDFHNIRDWLRECSAGHLTCRKRSKGLVEGLRVIDCTSRLIVNAPSDCSYVALSYVWGQGSSEDGVHENRILEGAPTVIRDAMKATIQLQLKYLWVDRYCIRQGEEEEKQRMIDSMDAIYEGADVTIIAAAGRGPDYGLPGVSTRRRFRRPVCKLGRHSITAMQDPSSEIKSSRWSSRGWTYQEMLLSRRRLVFTESQVYFQCQEMHRCEGLCLVDETRRVMILRDLIPIFPDKNTSKTSQSMYNLLQEYYRRHLSLERDVLNALEGIFNAFGGQEGSPPRKACHFWGLPIRLAPSRSLDSANFCSKLGAGLLWRVRHGDDGTPPQRRQGDWPSWSWTTFKGGALHFGYLAPERPPSNAQFTMTHRSGNEMELSAFAAQEERYDRFHPWLNMTVWAIAVSVHHDEDGKPHIFDNAAGVSSEYVNWDPAWAYDSPSSEPDEKPDAEITYAVFIEAEPIKSSLPFRLLLVQATDEKADAFRRVGIWTIFLEESLYPYSVKGPETSLPEPLLRTAFGSLRDTWQRRTLRLV